MKINVEKSKTLQKIGNITSIVAHVLLGIGVLALFTVPLFGIAIAFAAIVLYAIALVLAETLRRMSLRMAGETETLDYDTLRRKKRDRVTGSILLGFLLLTALTIYFTTQFN
jgi:hypothetical protein